MSVLKDRIMWLHQPGRVAELSDRGPGAKDYMAVTGRPDVAIAITTGGICMDDNPIISADGAPIPATGHARWGALYAAGRRLG